MKKILLIVLLIALIFFLKPYYLFLTKTLQISIFKTLFPGRLLKKTNNQVNILILGIAGGNHDGPNLSDSITLANYNFQTNSLTTIGIPRDVWSATLHDKINSAYAYGVAKGGQQDGLKLAKAAVENLINIPIHYAVVIDFEQFKELIDYVGGVDITVQKSFIDNQFPIAGRENDTCNGDPDFKCRYETVKFERGAQHMNGEIALKFVRSRHATNEEGSDFARSRRQQLVLNALKEKMMTVFRSGNLTDITHLYEKVDQSLVRDISNQQLAVIGKNILLKRHFIQKSSALPQTLFEVPDASDYDGKYTLIPNNNSVTLLPDFMTCLLTSSDDCSKVQ